MYGDCLVCIIVVVNILSLLIALVFTILGGIIIWSKPILQKITSLLVRQLSDVFGDNVGKPVDTLREEILELSKFAGILLLIVGVIMLLLAIMAFVGVGCYNWVLIAYATLVGIFVIVNIALIIVCFTKRDGPLKKVHTFLETQVKAYISQENGDALSLLIGALMRTLKCCGYNNGSDFKTPEANFSRRDIYNGVTYPDIQYPVDCCRRDVNYRTSYAYIINKRNAPFLTDKCPETFTLENSYKEVGCKNVVDEVFSKIFNFAGYFLIVMLIIEVILCGMTIHLAIIRRSRT